MQLLAAVAIHRMVFSARDPIQVTELEYAAHGTVAAVDHATLSLTTFH
jgi:hypothetical protein